MTRSAIFAIFLLTIVPPAAADDWKNVAPGVDYEEFTGGHIDVHVVRVDLTDEHIDVISTPEQYRATTVRDFATKMHAIAAINADYFDTKFNPIGLAIGPCGQWVGTKDTSREGVVAVGEGRALIQTQSEVFDPPEEWVSAAVSGWPMLVRECKPLSAKELPGSDAFTRAPHPRTAVGLSKDRKTLYLVVADGRRTGIPGMTLADLGAFMSDELNVCSAINLDGGGSTTMWVDDKVVNRPSDGVERRVGDHLAVVYRSDAVCPPPVLETADHRAPPASPSDLPAKASTSGAPSTATSTPTSTPTVPPPPPR